jgi:DNA-binding SARP family transcriptional activator
MADVEFRVLGPLEFKVDGRSIPLRGMKHQLVLGCLLTANNLRSSLAQLVDAVWGVNPPATAAKQIRNAVSDLRSVLAPGGARVTAVAEGYRLDIGDAWFDLAHFREHLARAQEELAARRPQESLGEFRSALALWRGPTLAGTENEQIRSQVAWLDEARLSAVEECFDLELAGNWRQSLVGELAAWAVEHPLRERLVAQYILALHRSGARARAFAVYEHTRRQLADLLGLSPGPGLAKVHQQILSDDAEPAPALAPFPARTMDVLPPARDNLPQRSGHFVGRSAELRALVADGSLTEYAPLLVIDGMPGVGKSALAVRAAYALADRFPDGRFLLDLGGHAPRDRPLEPLDGRTALRRLLVLTGDSEESLPQNVTDLALLWRRRTENRRYLVILDDVRQAELIDLLRPSGSACLTIVTSRRRFTLISPVPTRILSLDVFPREDSRQLFGQLLDDRRAAADPASVESILDNCGDLPLAVCAAAARLRRRPMWPARHLAERLADPMLLLSELQTERGGLFSCLDSSFRQLTPGQQWMLRRLSCLPGLTTDAGFAAALCDLPRYTAEQLLETLVDEHMLLQPQSGLYRLHLLVKTYGAQISMAAGELEPLPDARIPNGLTAV